MSTLREEIVASKSGKRMLSRVSPIYDESYVGLWMFEAIGREYDKLWDIADTLPQQMFVESVTWAIELWEQRYGITPAPSQSIEERRRRLLASRSAPRPFIPAILEQYISNLTGRQSEVVDHVRDFTFGAYITSDGGKSEADLGALLAYINRNKPSHMSCELAFQAVTTIGITVETGYWRFPYWMTDSAAAGQLPDTNMLGRQAAASIEANGTAAGYKIPYELSGTKPDTNILGRLHGDAVEAVGKGVGHPFGYAPSGIESSGTLPDTAMLGRAYADEIAAEVHGKGNLFPYEMAGVSPDINTIAVFGDDDALLTSDGQANRFAYPLPGEGETGTEPLYVKTSGTQDAAIRASPDERAYKISYTPCGATNSGTGIL